MTKHTLTIASRICHVYGEWTENVLIQPVDDHDMEFIESEIEKIGEYAGGIDFALIALRVKNWNKDLTPWEAPPVFGKEGFGSGAGETLSFITDELLPFASQQINLRKQSAAAADAGNASIDDADFDDADAGNSRVSDASFGKSSIDYAGFDAYIGGYSLAGLFALWAGYQTDVFRGVCAASPSVWYPGWIDYAATHEIKAQAVYLSLGDKEEKTKNQIMAKVGQNIQKQYEILEGRPKTTAILEWNEGNHFREPDIRTAKGFAWLLKQKDLRRKER